MIELRILTEEEIAALNEQAEAEAAIEVERVRRRDACVAEHGGHEWELELEHPDADDGEGGPVDLRCTRCPAGIEDVYLPDGQELIYLEVDGQDLVLAGRHSSPVPLIVPVDVDVWSDKYWTDYGYEYDSEMQISQRGAARPVGEGSA